MSRPLILVSNDDGWQAPGIQALADALESFAEVWVVAPERERSAVSHSISLHKPLRVRETAPQRYWVSGSPADCVYLGLYHLLPRRPDLVVTGINRGANMGDDVFYSGTIAAAREAVLGEIPAIAVSQLVASGVEIDYTVAALAAVRVARQLLAHVGSAAALPPRTLLSVNVPPAATLETPILTTPPGSHRFTREVLTSRDPRGQLYYWLGGVEVTEGLAPGTDCERTLAGNITVTAVSVAPRTPVAEAVVAQWDI